MKETKPNKTIPKIYPLGGSAITFEFGNEISLEANAIAISFSNALGKKPFAGFVECVPAYSSVTVFYDPKQSSQLAISRETTFDAVKKAVLRVLSNTVIKKEKEDEAIEIPVDFSAKFAPDLEFVADLSGIDRKTVIEIFTGGLYRVFMIGFLPGFPYMASVDPRIAAPRLETPRQSVPKGSIGIAGIQTGIYPLESPGGWRLIGKTETEMFLRGAARPTLLAPGNLVRFVSA